MEGGKKPYVLVTNSYNGYIGRGIVTAVQEFEVNL